MRAFDPSLRPTEIDAAYAQFQRDPGGCTPAWRDFFEALAPEARAWLDDRQHRPVSPQQAATAPNASGEAGVVDALAAQQLVRAFRERGHLAADLDPLKLSPRQALPELAPETHGFDAARLDHPVFLNGALGLESASIRELTTRLHEIYCGTLGLEFMHLTEPEPVEWLRERFELARRQRWKPEAKRALLEILTAAEGFEHFLDTKWKGSKRFGLDGGESTIPALEQILWKGSELGVEEAVLGMAHRGRLNVLANVMGKPLEAIFAEFRGAASHPDDVAGSGDVKYHLGTSSDRQLDGRPLHLSLVPNPSHLEAVDPVVCGKVRARQEQLGDTDRTRVLGILLHGDAAFAGQGLVSEVLQCSELDGYRTGGTIHLIINNQIGFTTNPVAARSGPYCSDVAKQVQAPIFHVNGDDPEAVVEAAELALAYRQTFQRDVVIDLFCYRRHGHNEGDEPAFTQPQMVKAIRAHATTRERYAQRLDEEGVVAMAEAETLRQQHRELCVAAFEDSESYQPKQADWLGAQWSGLEPVQGFDARRGKTGVPLERLSQIGQGLVTVPTDLHVHRKIERHLKARRAMFETGEGIDWATAEALAFGTLLTEGHGVRLSGEDVNRGTFSHRHASWIDQEDERRYVPLAHVQEQQGRCQIVNSPLSEFGVLGFEYGYAMAEPSALVVWEAQFGDFANGAQVVIDQFLAAGESKWLRMSGLVLLLPHGYEGQGPEHSSARLERFLQLCGEDNLQVVSCTTPANYFHVLRRQLHRAFRKPLVVMTPKSLLRHKQVVSRLADLGTDTEFHRVLHCDRLPCPPSEARQVVLCTGKVYYDLVQARQEAGIDDVHFLRVEQLYPFPTDALASELAPYRHCHLVWCQEEPRNMGAWSTVGEVIEEIARDIGFERPQVRYAGRESAASPATGVHERHLAQQRGLIDDALTVGRPVLGRLGARRGRTQSSA
ncbi:MAG: 2-oxoglutarate dehydrogenase E1 component [Myxococcota bacterium]